jgi:tetratricopeptide (TPR) repeat protein
MSVSINDKDPNSPGSKFLSKFTDTDALFVRNNPEQLRVGRGTAIPLQRFQELEQAIRNTPASPDPYYELGRIYVEQERWSDARRVLDAGVAACQDHEPMLVLREDLNLLLSQQLVEKAKTELAQKWNSDNKYTLEQAETSLANERIRVCRERFERHPDQKELLINWSIGLRQLGRLGEAVTLLLQAAAVPEHRARASLQLGMCYQNLDRPLDALGAFRKAAMYRDPPPEPAIRKRAFELAFELANELGLVDASIVYGERLVELCEGKPKEELSIKIAELKATAF